MSRLVLIISLLAFSLSQEAKISKSASILKSLVLPGWGNLSAGNTSTGYLHMGAELSLWLGYFYNKKLLNDSRTDYQNY
ncbi:MAG: hypothetical protein KDD94_09190, partial [Calditrichaeota bacterium]|nr:hypothetical protein [Calditrichota bacterium]